VLEARERGLTRLVFDDDAAAHRLHAQPVAACRSSKAWVAAIAARAPSASGSSGR
jgi:hypothetical protein